MILSRALGAHARKRLHSSWQVEFDSSQIHWIVIRSHNRPELCLKTYNMIRTLLPSMEVRVYVAECQMARYRQVFAGLGNCLHLGNLGAGPNVMSCVYDLLSATPAGNQCFGLMLICFWKCPIVAIIMLIMLIIAKTSAIVLGCLIFQTIERNVCYCNGLIAFVCETDGLSYLTMFDDNLSQVRLASGRFLPGELHSWLLWAHSRMSKIKSDASKPNQLHLWSCCKSSNPLNNRAKKQDDPRLGAHTCCLDSFSVWWSEGSFG